MAAAGAGAGFEVGATNKRRRHGQSLHVLLRETSRPDVECWYERRLTRAKSRFSIRDTAKGEKSVGTA